MYKAKPPIYSRRGDGFLIPLFDDTEVSIVARFIRPRCPTPVQGSTGMVWLNDLDRFGSPSGEIMLDSILALMYCLAWTRKQDLARMSCAAMSGNWSAKTRNRHAAFGEVVAPPSDLL